jgi:outer membrane lipoprotein SlyB
MWRVVAILALSLSGCVSTKPFDQAFGAEQGRQIVKSEIAFFLSGQVSAEPASQLR